MVKSPNLPEPLVAHFWDPVEATPVEITKPTTDAKKALTTLKTRVVKAEIAKSVREKHAQYGVTQAYFEKPENADKKAILESKLGIDLDTNPINSDAFIGALAHFQDEHK